MRQIAEFYQVAVVLVLESYLLIRYLNRRRFFGVASHLSSQNESASGVRNSLNYIT